jgi:hypothetical protein
MDTLQHDLEHPKKRRRREISQRPLSARLVFDDTVKGEAALVSGSLWPKLAGNEEGMAANLGLRAFAQHPR